VVGWILSYARQLNMSKHLHCHTITWH